MARRERRTCDVSCDVAVVAARTYPVTITMCPFSSTHHGRAHAHFVEEFPLSDLDPLVQELGHVAVHDLPQPGRLALVKRRQGHAVHDRRRRGCLGLREEGREGSGSSDNLYVS